jgi:hypothetical protein
MVDRPFCVKNTKNSFGIFTALLLKFNLPNISYIVSLVSIGMAGKYVSEDKEAGETGKSGYILRDETTVKTSDARGRGSVNMTVAYQDKLPLGNLRAGKYARDCAAIT